VQLLPLAELTYNNLINFTTSQTPFFAVYRYHPTFDPIVVRRPILTPILTAASHAQELQLSHENL
jgi:hypothetical protein